ncbi:hypothetical protein AB9K26_07270 [Psychroserpens sp. XS_ASV72]|uniref:hypothetical protein n=1 Tax=Psychroserpens sp. XS_ASV72 TaxID=3241293 RepID=UPI00351965B1
MLDIISELLWWHEDYKFSKRKKKRREFEKQNNLPKKLMIHPVWKLFGILFLVAIPIIYFILPNGNKVTLEKIAEIQMILEKEKNDLESYPANLTDIIRNNPLRKDITLDYWKNEFFYEQTENGMGFVLISKGKDGILGTDDDINRTKNLP